MPSNRLSFNTDLNRALKCPRFHICSPDVLRLNVPNFNILQIRFPKSSRKFNILLQCRGRLKIIFKMWNCCIESWKHSSILEHPQISTTNVYTPSLFLSISICCILGKMIHKLYLCFYILNLLHISENAAWVLMRLPDGDSPCCARERWSSCSIFTICSKFKM